MHTGETTSSGEASSGWSGDVVGSGRLGSWQGSWALVMCPGTAPWKARWDPSHYGSPGSGSRLVQPLTEESSKQPRHATGAQGPSLGLPEGSGQNHLPG